MLLCSFLAYNLRNILHTDEMEEVLPQASPLLEDTNMNIETLQPALTSSSNTVVYGPTSPVETIHANLNSSTGMLPGSVPGTARTGYEELNNQDIDAIGSNNSLQVENIPAVNNSEPVIVRIPVELSSCVDQRTNEEAAEPIATSSNISIDEETPLLPTSTDTHVVNPPSNLAVVNPMMTTRFPYVFGSLSAFSSPGRPCIYSRPPTMQHAGVMNRMQLFDGSSQPSSVMYPVVCTTGQNSTPINNINPFSVFSSNHNITTVVTSNRTTSSRCNSSEPLDLSIQANIPHDDVAADESNRYRFSSPLNLTVNSTSNQNSDEEATDFPFTSPTPRHVTVLTSNGVPADQVSAYSTATTVPWTLYRDPVQQPGLLQFSQFLADPENSNEYPPVSNTVTHSPGFQWCSVDSPVTPSLRRQHLNNEIPALCSITTFAELAAITRDLYGRTNSAETTTSRGNDTSIQGNILPTTTSGIMSQNAGNATFTSASNVFNNDTYTPSDFHGPSNPFGLNFDMDNTHFLGPVSLTPNVIPPSNSCLKNRECNELQNKINKLLTEKNTLLKDLQESQEKTTNQKIKLKSLQKEINKLETDKNQLTHKVHKQKEKLSKARDLQDVAFQLMLKCSYLEEGNKCLRNEKRQLTKDMDTLFEFYSRKLKKGVQQPIGDNNNAGSSSGPDVLNLQNQINEADIDIDDDDDDVDDDDAIIQDDEDVDDDEDEDSDDSDDEDSDDDANEEGNNDQGDDNDDEGFGGPEENGDTADHEEDNRDDGTDGASNEHREDENNHPSADDYHQNNGYNTLMGIDHRELLGNKKTNTENMKKRANCSLYSDCSSFQPYPNLLENNIIVYKI